MKLNRLVTWALATIFAILILTLVGCTAVWPTSPAESEVEMLLLSETGRFATLQGVDVRGEITDKVYAVPFGAFGCTLPAGCLAVGWYNGGVAYYNREMVAQYVDISGARDIACHEVCHAKHPAHDLAHWECMNRWAAPTYPRP